MKKLIALLLSLILVFSLCSVSAFAEETPSETEKESEITDVQITYIFFNYLTELDNRGIITRDEYATVLNTINLERLLEDGYMTDDIYKVINTIKALATYAVSNETNETDLPNEYSFGQGTFVVGLDLKPGTYDITCESSSGNDMDSSMAGLSDFYNSQGMSEYADMINSMSGMYDSIGGMIVKTYKAGGSYHDQYLTLKAGETARIILEDGGKIEISDGTAKLVWIR